jgi:hypothetical protein
MNRYIPGKRVSRVNFLVTVAVLSGVSFVAARVLDKTPIDSYYNRANAMIQAGKLCTELIENPAPIARETFTFSIKGADGRDSLKGVVTREVRPDIKRCASNIKVVSYAGSPVLSLDISSIATWNPISGGYTEVGDSSFTPIDKGIKLPEGLDLIGAGFYCKDVKVEDFTGEGSTLGEAIGSVKAVVSISTGEPGTPEHLDIKC